MPEPFNVIIFMLLIVGVPAVVAALIYAAKAGSKWPSTAPKPKGFFMRLFTMWPH